MDSDPVKSMLAAIAARRVLASRCVTFVSETGCDPDGRAGKRKGDYPTLLDAEKDRRRGRDI